MFCARGLVFSGTEGIRYRFLIFCSRTRFRRCLVRRIPYSCSTCPYSFSTIPRASGPIFMFCVPGLVFGRTEGVGFRFHVLCARTHFRRYRWRRFPFSCFVHPESFSAVTSASGPVFFFNAPGHIFDGTEVAGSLLHVLDSFLAVSRVSGTVFMLCEPGLIFDNTKGAGSRFHLLLARTRFRRY
jgi:hypothetical protein